MVTLKLYFVSLIEILAFLTIGFLLTENVVRDMYDSTGIRYYGNGVNWFAVSFFLYGLYTVLLSKVLDRPTFFKELVMGRMASKTFWVISGFSIVGILLPFILGEIPY